MGKVVPVQDNFSAGEISKRFLAQVNNPAYKNGVRDLVNFIPTSQGPVRRRWGTRYVQEHDGAYARSFGFPISSDLVAEVCITDQGTMWLSWINIPIFNNNKVVNGHFYAGSSNWTNLSVNSGYVVFNTGSAKLVPGVTHDTVSRYSAIQQSVTLAGASPHLLEIHCMESERMCRMRVMIGSSLGGSDIFDYWMEESEPSLVVEVPFGTTTPHIQLIAAENTEGRDRVINHVSIRNPPGSTQDSFSTPWDTAELTTLQVGMPPGEDTMYFVSRTQAPQELKYDRTTDTWSFGAVSFTSSPWSAGDYPGSIAFFQGRMWLGGTPSMPEQFWGSKSADYTNLTTGANPDDALSFTMANKGIIQWMAGTKNLLIGTEYGEYICESDSGTIIPGDIGVNQQSAYGSAQIQPVQIGNHLLYVSSDGRKVREMGYKWTEDGWTSRDITYVSEHITKGNLIQDIVFAQNPDNLILATTQTGDLIGAVYERGNDVVGWFRIQTTGRVTGISSVDLRGNSIVSMAVNREVQSTSHIYRETFGVYKKQVDSFVLIPEVTSPYTVTVPHLADQTVNVVVDGAIHPDITLDSSGEGTLEWGGSEVLIGLPFTATLNTLPLATVLQIGQSTLAHTKRYNKIFVRLFESYYPVINGTRPPTRHPSTPMDTAEPAITGDIKVTNLGWSSDAQITIEQDLPLATNVAGIFGEAAEELLGTPG